MSFPHPHKRKRSKKKTPTTALWYSRDSPIPYIQGRTPNPIFGSNPCRYPPNRGPPTDNSGNRTLEKILANLDAKPVIFNANQPLDASSRRQLFSPRTEGAEDASMDAATTVAKENRRPHPQTGEYGRPPARPSIARRADGEAPRQAAHAKRPSVHTFPDSFATHLTSRTSS